MEQGLKGRMLPANPVVFPMYSVVLSWQEGLTSLGDGAVYQRKSGKSERKTSPSLRGCQQ